MVRLSRGARRHYSRAGRAVVGSRGGLVRDDDGRLRGKGDCRAGARPRSLRPRRLRLAAQRQGTYTATFATALGTALLGALVPPFLIVSPAAALGLLLVGPGPGGLRSCSWIGPPALLGPWVGSVVEDWRLLLSGPGLLSTAAPPEPWRILGEAGAAAPAVAAPLLAAFASLAALAALGFAAKGRSRAESVGLGVAGALAVVGLAIALGSGRVIVGSAETGVGVSAAAHLWTGIGLELWIAGLLIGILVASRVVRRLRVGGSFQGTPPRRWRVVAATCVGGSSWSPCSSCWRSGGWPARGTLTVGEATLPAVAVEQSNDPLSNRLLLLRSSTEVVDFVLTGREPGDLLRDLDRPATADDQPLVDAVARLVGGRSTDVLDASELADWGIGFVQSGADSGDPLARRLDATQGLTRLGASDHGILWKVQPRPSAPSATPVAAPSRASDRRRRWASDRRRAHPRSARRCRAAGPGRHRSATPVSPSRPSGPGTVWWSWTAVDCSRWQQTQPSYDLPPAGGLLHIDLTAYQPWWRLAQAGVLVFVAFMALPFGNRRSRRSRS